jgi:hypothetical protein
VVSDVWVLTIPGFQWFQGEEGTSRMVHRCVVAANRQMISIGAWVASSLSGDTFDEEWQTLDIWPEGIGVLDLTAMTWSSKYDVGASAYETPEAIQAWYAAGYVILRSLLMLFCTVNVVTVELTDGPVSDSNLASVSWSSNATKAVFTSSRFLCNSMISLAFELWHSGVKRLV